MKTLSKLGVAIALSSAMAASAVHAAPFSVTQRTSAGEQDISSWITSVTVDDMILGGEMLSEVLEERWSPELSAPFQDEDGQWLAEQMGTRSVQRTMRNDHFSFDYSEFSLYDYDLPAENPTQVVFTNTGELLSPARDLIFSGYLGNASSSGEVKLLIDGQPLDVEYLDAGPDGSRYWRYFNSPSAAWLENGYHEISLTALNGAYITEAWFSQTDNVQFQRSEVVTVEWDEVIYQTVSVPSPVPEPSTWALGVLGLAVLAWRRQANR